MIFRYYIIFLVILYIISAKKQPYTEEKMEILGKIFVNLILCLFFSNKYKKSERFKQSGYSYKKKEFALHKLFFMTYRR